MSQPSVDLNALVAAFEAALTLENNSIAAEADAQAKFDLAAANLSSTKAATINAGAGLYDAGTALVAGIQALIAPFAPPPQTQP